MSSACSSVSVPPPSAAVIPPTRPLTSSHSPIQQQSISSHQPSISYEGTLSLLSSSDINADHQASAIGNSSSTATEMDFDHHHQAVVLRRIKAECDSMLDFKIDHHHNFMAGVDLSGALQLAAFSPTSTGLFSSTDALPATPVRSQMAPESVAVSGGDQQLRQNNDSGISPGSTGAGGAGSSSSSVDEMGSVKNGVSGGDLLLSQRDDARAPRSSPFSVSEANSSADERRMMLTLTPMDEDDDEMLEEEEEEEDLEEDEDLLDDEEGSCSRGAGSDVVGDALSRLERALMNQQQQTDGSSTSSTAATGTAAAYQCSMCAYTATSRFHFQAHLNSHFDVKCLHCDFTARTEGKLRAHMRNAHSDVAGMELEETRSSRVSQAPSKSKSHKCKHPECGFVAVSKSDFWEHSRQHIKAEKLLTCPHCPFVTEYKHHLEYHTRNHLNSKPFKCPKCSYSCVNKSMLNSHMKSHSNVYQFRCKDCAYATKYQHSLKLHLRKYGHTSTCSDNLSLNGDMEPMVPSPSGKGGKARARKPKKPRTPKATKQQQQQNANVDQSNNKKSAAFALPPSGPQSTGNGQLFGFPGLYAGHPLLQPPQSASGMVVESDPSLKQIKESLRCSQCDYTCASLELFSQHLIAHAAADQHQRELANLFAGVAAAASADQLLLNGGSSSPSIDSMTAASRPCHTAPVSASGQMTPLKGGNNSSTPHNNHHHHQVKDYLSRMMLANPTLLFTPPTGMQQQQQQQQRRKSGDEVFLKQLQQQHSRTPTPETSPAPAKTSQTPLDLSCDKDDPASPAAAAALLLPANNNKHRRKGQAFKLERTQSAQPAAASSPVASPNVSIEQDVPVAPAVPEINEVKQQEPANSTKSRNGSAPTASEWGGAYQCTYCDIAFKDVVMYTMHMGYHGYQDPFTCNMCGHSTNDKLAFFLHIARSSHS